MDPDVLIAAFRESLTAITVPRFYQTERGFQGELLQQLSRRLNLEDPAIVEQEYQKSQHVHGLTIRPDIIIHEPFDPARHATHREGNLAVAELKLAASPAQADGDFESLGLMLSKLDYPTGLFINIASSNTHANRVSRKWHGRIVCFAVALVHGQTRVIEERA
jgi:hypothetical protein